MEIEKLDKLRKEVDEQQVKSISEAKLSREDALVEAEYIVKKAMMGHNPQEGANPMQDLVQIFGKGYAYLKAMGYGDETTHNMFKQKISDDMNKKVV